ncbi:LysM peptidoglycan-binding domain-containing protein [Halobacteriovorax sp. HLS]|uniref:LysM peptidoglycan-binding domain-containing protein n=1 Tax=Halobacteriovorax sp. HLS TaxID=2234000 RepID=UPI000FDB9B50|nr:LysM peptidoglycan-binding domain-containing protein [Halobacteriovorax sp. HLS]
MKISKVLLVLALLTLGVSCSSKRKKDDASKTADISTEVSAEDADFIVDSEDENLLEDNFLDDNNSVVEEVASSEAPAQVMEEGAPMMEESSSIAIAAGGEYTVQKGDTLMWIAFKVYGDYRKWQTLSSINNGISESSLREGMTLRHDSPGFNYNPQGLPHLIKTGDTLGTISNEKYGTQKRWKEIWDNNKEMIHDSNLIFAGFTLYYLPDRDIASEDI